MCEVPASMNRIEDGDYWEHQARVSDSSPLTGSVPESFAKAFDAFKMLDEARDRESIRSAFKAQEAWSNLQKELIAWVERERSESGSC